MAQHPAQPTHSTSVMASMHALPATVGLGLGVLVVGLLLVCPSVRAPRSGHLPTSPT